MLHEGVIEKTGRDDIDAVLENNVNPRTYANDAVLLGEIISLATHQRLPGPQVRCGRHPEFVLEEKVIIVDEVMKNVPNKHLRVCKEVK
jgi:hypothetical protein